MGSFSFTASSRALDTIDFNSLSGHIFEGVTAAATGATLTDSQAIFDFAGINKEVVDRINKLFIRYTGGEIFSVTVLR